MKKIGFFGAILALMIFTGLYFPTPLEEGEVAALSSPAPNRALGSTSAAAPDGSAPAKKDLVKELRATKACYETDDCAFPQTDPRSYSFAVGKKIASQLADFRQNSIDDPAAAEVAREFVKVQDGFVQDEAMKIFSALPPSRANVEAMIEGLADAHDPLLIAQAMKEWERYIGTSEEALIQEFLADFVARGGQFSSEKASEHILAFLNERSVDAFRAALAGMIPESTQARNLRAALAEYERLRSGG